MTLWLVRAGRSARNARTVLLVRWGVTVCKKNSVTTVTGVRYTDLRVYEMGQSSLAYDMGAPAQYSFTSLLPKKTQTHPSHKTSRLLQLSVPVQRQRKDVAHAFKCP